MFQYNHRNTVVLAVRTEVSAEVLMKKLNLSDFGNFSSTKCELLMNN